MFKNLIIKLLKFINHFIGKNKNIYLKNILKKFILKDKKQNNKVIMLNN